MTISGQDNRKPVVAVLTSSDPFRKFTGNRANFQDILKTGKQMGHTVYIVTTKDLKLTSEQILGYTYNLEQKRWHTQWFPLPDIVYNRIPSREDELDIVIRKKIDECMKHPNIHIFNPFYFNKWKLFSWLKSSNQTEGFVPETKRLNSRKGLILMLIRYPDLYLKPESGKAGKGIMKLSCNPDDPKPYKLIIPLTDRNIVYKTSKLPLLWKRVYKETRGTPYIVQQGITLNKFEGKSFDLRALIQKTGRGNWSVTGIGARLAGKRRITTHVPQGGSVEDPQQMLLPAFGEERVAEILAQARADVITLARQIERASGHLLGEMSMDLGVDDQGKIWFFEANAKPMKFDEPQIRQKSLQRLFQFSQYLTRLGKA